MSVDPARHDDLAAKPFDAVVLLSFGGPEAPEEVMPFLENVTRGRGIPPDRLTEVAEHYLERGGRSPINDRNRELLAALRSRLADRGVHVPVYWGNRNWSPYLTDVLREVHEDGCRRVLVLATSAYSSYSSCRQYREDVASALLDLATEGRLLHVDKARNYFNHPGFVTASVDAVLGSLRELGWHEAEGGRRGGADGAGGEWEDGLVPHRPTLPRLVYVTHSIPTAMADTSGPDGGAYVAQHQDLAAVVTRMVSERTRLPLEWDLVYCSRSGPPSQPWLEPDVNDHLEALAAAGTTAVVLVPIGFVSDHMEVVHDLDTEAAQTAAGAGLRMVRAATAGVHAAFVDCLVDLVVERAAAERGEVLRRAALGSLPAWHDVCPAGCCPDLRNPGRAAACGADWTDPVPAGVAP